MGNPVTVYSKTEINLVRDYITGAKTVMREPSLEPLRKDMERNPNLIHFRRLLGEDAYLLEKIKSDSRVAPFSFFMFMPFLESRLGTDMKDVKIRITEVEDFGSAARIKVEGVEVTIRPVHNLDEPFIAKLADERGIGPKQQESWDGFVTEEFVNGKMFPEISRTLKPDEAERIGMAAGDMVAMLHFAGIKLNKPVFEDAMGRSHLRIGEKIWMVDFSGAIKTLMYPKLSYMRMFWYLVSGTEKADKLRGHATSAKELDEEVRRQQETLSKVSLESFLRTDLRAVHDALLDVTALKNENAARIVWNSFLKGYDARMNEREPEIDLALP